jgi:novobiocin biosynthesis protein NovU/D-mycarose 3-C-methyltransferase
MYKLVTRCRACGFGQRIDPGGIKSAPSTDKLLRVLNLGVQPLANDFRKEGEARAGFAPLELLFCPNCSLAQLSVVVDPATLYSNYSYVTSPSLTMREHFGQLVQDIATEQESRGSAVEIGSNDGLFLAFLADSGYGNVIGIDPAENLAANARRSGVAVVNDFFSDDSARQAAAVAGDADLIIARHVFCHINDWSAFVKSLDILASRNTLICIEVPCVTDQIDSGSFDQIYHEHLSYLSLKSMKALLRDSLFHLHRVIHYPVHGGASLIMIRRNDCDLPPHPSVANTLESENVTLERWEKFSDESSNQIQRLAQKVRDLRAEGNRICGFGASAKSTVWINACGFNKGDIYGVYDGTIQKQYCTIPGTNIPVIHEGAFYADAPDYAVCFAWNFLPEILTKHHKWMESGGRFIVPVPKLRVIGLDTSD